MGRRVAAERSALQAVTPLTEGFAPMSTPWRWRAASRSCRSEVMPRRRAAVWASVMRPKAVVRRVGVWYSGEEDVVGGGGEEH